MDDRPKSDNFGKNAMLDALTESGDYLAKTIAQDPNNGPLKTALGSVVRDIERYRNRAGIMEANSAYTGQTFVH